MEDETKYTAWEARQISEGVQRISVHPEKMSAGPSLIVEWDERHGFLSTVGGGAYPLKLHAVPIHAVDALVAGWLQARPLEVYSTLAAVAERAMEEAGKRERDAFERYQTDRTTEHREAWLVAHHAEGLAIQADVHARQALAAARAALDGQAKLAWRQAEERNAAI